MPKRLIDDSYLNSPSMAVCSSRADDSYPRFLLLCDDFGCFEVNPRALLARGWPNRKDVTEDDLLHWLEEYSTKRAPEQPPVAMLWAERGRRYCYLTGWDGPHGQRKRIEYKPNGTSEERHGSKRRTPPPPPELLKVVMSDNFLPGNLPGINREEQDKNLNDSIPARELTGSTLVPSGFPESSRPLPAHVVPDPVAVPDPVPAAIACLPARACEDDQDEGNSDDVNGVWTSNLNAARARHLVEKELGRRVPVSIRSQETAATERWVELVNGYIAGAGQTSGMDHFLSVCRAAIQRCLAGQRRRKELETGPESLAYFVGPLADGLTYVDPQVRRFPSALPASASDCPTWGTIVVYLEENVRKDLFERWFSPLRAELNESNLVLLAPDPFFAGFLKDNYLVWLQEIATRVGKIQGELRIESRDQSSLSVGVTG